MDEGHEIAKQFIANDNAYIYGDHASRVRGLRDLAIEASFIGGEGGKDTFQGGDVSVGRVGRVCWSVCCFFLNDELLCG